MQIPRRKRALSDNFITPALRKHCSILKTVLQAAAELPLANSLSRQAEICQEIFAIFEACMLKLYRANNCKDCTQQSKVIKMHRFCLLIHVFV